MLANYRTFGDAVSFDITYKVCSYYATIEKRDDDGNITKDEKYWNLGVFSVFMEDCRPLICGICLILHETIMDFCSLFTLLYDATKQFPKSIITDQQAAVISALDILSQNE